MRQEWEKLIGNRQKNGDTIVIFWFDKVLTFLDKINNVFIHVKNVKNENLKDIIRFYYIEYFIKLLKGRFTIGSLDTLYVAPLNCHWNCLKYKGCWLRILGDSSNGSANISDKFVAYGPPRTEGFYCYGDKVLVIP